MHIEIHNHLTIPSTVKLIVFEIQKHLKQFKQFCFKFYCFVSPHFPTFVTQGFSVHSVGSRKDRKPLVCEYAISLSLFLSLTFFRVRTATFLHTVSLKWNRPTILRHDMLIYPTAFVINFVQSVGCCSFYSVYREIDHAQLWISIKWHWKNRQDIHFKIPSDV